MKKDSQSTFRIPSDLKVRLEEIKLSEGRSVAQICVALLQEGLEIYKKKGPSFLQRLLGAKEESVRSTTVLGSFQETSGL